MHVTLLHNPSAGEGEYSRHKLVRALVAAGHAVTYQSTKEKDYARALTDPGDVVLVAGGDGTVRKAAGALLGRDVPLALLPMGTANNVAKALGVEGSPEEVIAGLAASRPQRFDAGVVKGSWGEGHFLEAVGLGLFPVTMCLVESRADHREGRAEHEDLGITRDVRYLSRVLRDLRPQAWQIELDGQDVSGEFLLCEVMNIPSIGPNLRLAPGADAGDGLLDVVLATERERESLREHVAARVAGDDHQIDLPIRRAREICIVAHGAELHVDDELQRPGEAPSAAGARIQLSLLPGALRFLV
ncbi:MAG TPA: diacylglycerol kinase family protein [Gemmatimonadales bacterium]|jgi:diacylglycerol kinase family enzyme|nr:diacylglycerol kinase family protein [Gemmatimonadales bacterium]